jgi:hypothetical protein
MIEIENRHTGAKRSKLADSQGKAMLWIAGRLEANHDSPEVYRLRDEPGKAYGSTADLPMQTGRYDDWD